MAEPCLSGYCSDAGCCVGHAPILTLQGWHRARAFINDLTDPEMYGLAISDEIRRRALEIKVLFEPPL